MLIKCPECSLQISDKAYSCPHCGLPMKPGSRKHIRSNRKMKLPNGFGQISFIKGNLRKPYRAMVTISFSENGRPIAKLLRPQAYFESYNQAYEALVEYNKNPYNELQDLSLEEMYRKWFNDTKNERNDRTNNYYELAWSHIKQYGEMPFKEIKIPNIRAMMTNESLSKSAPAQIKNLMNQIYDYAVEHEVVQVNLSRQTKVKGATNKTSTQHHMSFTDEEISKLWKNSQEYFTRGILLQCYTGLRPGELCEIRMENIFLDKNYMIAGFKTKAGTDRIIPIHPSIKPILTELYEYAKSKGSKYLMLNRKDTPLKPLIYRGYFVDICKQLGLSDEHKCHDPRKFFVTEAKRYQLDEYAIKRIVGHAITDLTESVYTERGVEWLYSEICKIKV